MKVSVLEGFARHAVRPAVLFVFVSSITCVCLAQAAGSTAQPAMNPAVPAPAPANSAQAVQPAAQAERQRGGTHEGIHVHGHWTIEVRNPDGKLVSHTEFENSLISGEGDALLAQLLTGGQTLGNWLVFLNTSALPPNSYPYSQPGPCGTSGVSACILGQSGSSAFTQTLSPITPTTCATNGNCFSTLSVSVTGANRNEVQLTGTATADTSGSIGSVTSLANTCYGEGGTGSLSSASPSTCFSVSSTSSTIALYDDPFTSATLSAPVSVSAGQMIAVTVLISFQ
jgi:hypothetical protein